MASTMSSIAMLPRSAIARCSSKAHPLQLRLSIHNVLRSYTTTATTHDFSTLKVSQDRLMTSLHETCEWGKGTRWGSSPTDTGMSRLTLTDDDKRARDWFAETTTNLGCKLTIDSMGNMFAIRPGKNKSAPPTVAGSHLDTQPTGGRYDGILGVMAGVEMLRVLKEMGWETEGGVGVVNWTNEEGARFPKSMVSSGVWAGKIPIEDAWNLEEIHPGPDGRRRNMKEELERIRYLGKTNCSYTEYPLGAHFELHIEQGPILEQENLRIGIVQGGQAYRWFTITIHGRDSHTGTTPMAYRADPMSYAAHCISRAYSTAIRHGGLAATGVISALPGSTNTIPHTVKMSLDMRHQSDDALENMVSKLRTSMKEIESEGITAEWRVDTDSPAVRFDEGCIGVIRDTLEARGNDGNGGGGSGGGGVGWKEMVSGAGHDSCYTSYRCPTAMVFVPCRDGKSHTPSEYCKPEDCALGTQILMESILRYDLKRKERGDFS